MVAGIMELSSTHSNAVLGKCLRAAFPLLSRREKESEKFLNKALLDVRSPEPCSARLLSTPPLIYVQAVMKIIRLHMRQGDADTLMAARCGYP